MLNARSQNGKNRLFGRLAAAACPLAVRRSARRAAMGPPMPYGVCSVRVRTTQYVEMTRHENTSGIFRTNTEGIVLWAACDVRGIG